MLFFVFLSSKFFFYNNKEREVKRAAQPILLCELIILGDFVKGLTRPYFSSGYTLSRIWLVLWRDKRLENVLYIMTSLYLSIHFQLLLNLLSNVKLLNPCHTGILWNWYLWWALRSHPWNGGFVGMVKNVTFKPVMERGDSYVWLQFKRMERWSFCCSWNQYTKQESNRQYTSSDNWRKCLCFTTYSTITQLECKIP